MADASAGRRQLSFDDGGYLVGTAIHGQIAVPRTTRPRPTAPPSVPTVTPLHPKSSSDPLICKLRRVTSSFRKKKVPKSASSVSLASAYGAREDPSTIPPVPPLSISLPGPLLFQDKEEQTAVAPRDLTSDSIRSPNHLPYSRDTERARSREPYSTSPSSNQTNRFPASNTSLSSDCSMSSLAMSSTSSCTSIESSPDVSTPLSSRFPTTPALPQRLASPMKHTRSASRKSHTASSSCEDLIAPSQYYYPPIPPTPTVPGIQHKRSFVVNGDVAMGFWTASSPVSSTWTLRPSGDEPHSLAHKRSRRTLNERPATAPTYPAVPRSVEEGAGDDWADVLLEGIPPKYGGGVSSTPHSARASRPAVNKQTSSSPSQSATSITADSRIPKQPEHHQASGGSSPPIPFSAAGLLNRRRERLTSTPDSPQPPSAFRRPRTTDSTMPRYPQLPKHPYALAGEESSFPSSHEQSPRKSHKAKRASHSATAGGGSSSGFNDLPPPSPPPACPLPSIPCP